MKNQEVITDESGITFFPSQPNRYRIMWWQIDKDGYDWWVTHLREKIWFNEELRKKFIELCVDVIRWPSTTES